MKTPYTSAPLTMDERLPARDGALNSTATGIHGIVDKVAGYAHQTVDQAVTGTAPATEWLDEQAAALNTTQKQLVSSTRQYVTAHPLMSVGIAVAAGFLISHIFRN